MSNRGNGGNAFPIPTGFVPAVNVEQWNAAQFGMSLRDYFAIRAPAPTKDLIELYQRTDMEKNPHNDPHKPPIRNVDEITAFLSYRYADAMLAERAK